MKKSKTYSTIFAVVFFLLFYAPLISLVIFSFNTNKSVTNFGGFSLKWYKNLFTNKQIIKIVISTLYIAILSTICSVIIGTLASIALTKLDKKSRNRILRLNNIPITNPDIVIAIGLILLFVSIGVERGYGTMLLAHISFCTPYVIVTVYPKVKSIGPNVMEAAMDLGAHPMKAIRTAILPQIKSSIFAAAAIAFTMSFDDFVISYFTGGKSMNISTYLYTTAKKLNPTFNALSTIIILVIVAKVVVDKIRENKKNKAEEMDYIPSISTSSVVLKRIGIVGILAFLVIAPFFLFANNKNTLYIFLPGEYIDNDPIDGEDLVSKFEKKYKANIELSTFESNEAALTKLETEQYDIVIPSDYAIEQLIEEDYLQPIDWDKLNITKSSINHDLVNLISDVYSGEEYDLLDYGVPYFCGSVGIVYNKDNVSLTDLETYGWDILKDTRYKKKIAFYDSARDGFMVALKALGYSANTEDETELKAAYSWLKDMVNKMSPVFKTDELLDEMPQGKWDLTYMYSGDAVYVMQLAEEEGVNLGYYVPTSGSNVFVDEMVIPTNAKNVDLAYDFINFMCEYDNALANTEYVCYTTPIEEVYDDLLAEDGDFYDYSESYTLTYNDKMEMFRYLPDTKKWMVKKYSELKL